MNRRNLLIITAGALLIFYSFSIISCMNSEKMNETANENPYDVLIACIDWSYNIVAIRFDCIHLSDLNAIIIPTI